MNATKSLRKTNNGLKIFTDPNTRGHITKDGWVVPPKPANIIDVGEDEFVLEYSDEDQPKRCLWLSVVGRKSDNPLPIGAEMNPQILHPARNGLFREIITPQLVTKAGTLFGKEIRHLGFLFAVELGFESWEEVFTNWMHVEFPHGRKSIADFIMGSGDFNNSIFPDSDSLHHVHFGQTDKKLSVSFMFWYMYMKGIIDLGTLGTIKSDIQRGPNLIFTGTLGLKGSDGRYHTIKCEKKPHLLSIVSGLERPFAYRV